MSTRKQSIEEILHSFHAIRNITKAKAASLSHQNHITHSQWFVLTMIEYFKKTSVKNIAQSMEMSSSAVTQLVNGLVQAGLVTRKEDPKDRRLVQLELSPKGEKHLVDTREKRIAEMAEIFDTLTDHELEEFARLHNKIISKFSAKKFS